MATTNVTTGTKKMDRSDATTSAGRNENHLLLSTTYALNYSDTKRLQVGLRSTNTGGFEAIIKLSGNSSAGIIFDADTWKKFQDNMEQASAYLCGIIKTPPESVFINNVIIQFTSAYGARAIAVSYSLKASTEKTETQPGDHVYPPAKKRKTYVTSIVMQKTSFEGLERVLKCIDAHYAGLNSIANHVSDCARFLVTEIELNLPKRSLDENVVKQTLATEYSDIEKNVQRQIKNLPFLDIYFNIVFLELTSIYLNEIVHTVLLNHAT